MICRLPGAYYVFNFIVIIIFLSGAEMLSLFFHVAADPTVSINGIFVRFQY